MALFPSFFLCFLKSLDFGGYPACSPSPHSEPKSCDCSTYLQAQWRSTEGKRGKGNVHEDAFKKSKKKRLQKQDSSVSILAKHHDELRSHFHVGSLPKLENFCDASPKVMIAEAEAT